MCAAGVLEGMDTGMGVVAERVAQAGAGDGVVGAIMWVFYA